MNLYNFLYLNIYAKNYSLSNLMKIKNIQKI